MALDALDIRALDAALGRASGELLASSKQNDVIDAALVLLAQDGDQIVTSDRATSSHSPSRQDAMLS